MANQVNHKIKQIIVQTLNSDMDAEIDSVERKLEKYNYSNRNDARVAYRESALIV